MSKLLSYVGTFADVFYVIEFDPESQKLELLKTVDAPRRSAYFALSEDQTKLYIANEYQHNDGGVTVFDVSDPKDPKKIQVFSTSSQGPSYISIADLGEKKFVLGSGYFDGDVTVFPVKEDGTLDSMSCKAVLKDEGRAHCVRQIPNTSIILVTDTNNGKVVSYTLNEDGSLTKRKEFSDPHIVAQRHMVFSPDNKYLYVVTERGNSLEVYEIDEEKGEITSIQSLDTLPEGWEGESMCAAIHISEDGKYIYCSNRGHDSITTFAVGSDGKVEKVGITSEGIDWPREFMIDPTGKYVLVGNQEERSIGVYRILENGMLEFTGERLPLQDGPICFMFNN